MHHCDLAQEQTSNEQLQKALQEETNLKEEILNLLTEESVLKQTGLTNLERESAINTELRTQAADGKAQIHQLSVARAASEAQLANIKHSWRQRMHSWRQRVYSWRQRVLSRLVLRLRSLQKPRARNTVR